MGLLVDDNWRHRSAGMLCRTCISFVPKVVEGVHFPRPAPGEGMERPPVLGRCRKHAPTMQGFPVVFETDWCGTTSWTSRRSDATQTQHNGGVTHGAEAERRTDRALQAERE